MTDRTTQPPLEVPSGPEGSLAEGRALTEAILAVGLCTEEERLLEVLLAQASQVFPTPHWAVARVERGELILHQCHIDPYEKAAVAYNHIPARERKLLVHKRELHKLEDATKVKGTTLIPLAIYFKDGFAKLELGVAKGKRQHDKRETIKRKEQERDLRRMTMHRQ